MHACNAMQGLNQYEVLLDHSPIYDFELINCDCFASIAHELLHKSRECRFCFATYYVSIATRGDESEGLSHSLLLFNSATAKNWSIFF